MMAIIINFHKTMNSLKIIFMGTPDFCSYVFITTKSSRSNWVNVSDNQWKRAKIKTSAIKDYAIKNNLLTLQPENLKDPGSLINFRN